METMTNYPADVDKVSFFKDRKTNLPPEWWLQQMLNHLRSSRKVEDYAASMDGALITVYNYIQPEK
jgi:hypothetical protein